MKMPINKFSLPLLFLSLLLLSSCIFEDSGALQPAEQVYAVSGFDRLEMGSALKIDVQRSTDFYVSASGDARNIEDLEVFTSGGKLVVRYDNFRNRKHTTHVTIHMPELQAAKLSGASESTISGFSGDFFELNLSGASVCDFDALYDDLKLDISGASRLIMQGTGTKMRADVSGASELRAFNYPVEEAHLNISGASTGRVTVSGEMQVVASGASSVRYRGNPAVYPDVSGGSSVRKD